MKALIPGGFMPGFNNGTFTAEICAESSSTSQPEQLGLRLNQSQKATAAARLTADRKFLASLS
jgi:hypothetical protein